MFAGHLYFQGIAERSKARRATVSRFPVSQAAAPMTAETEDFFRKLFAAVGLPAQAYRSSALNRRVPACLRFLRARDLKAAWQKLDANPELVAPTVGVVLLGVTEFCRDRVVFDQLRQLAAGPLASLKRPLRVWSAACSDGHELYSVAILLNEAGLLAGSDLLGTDCRREAIRRAAAGEFTPEALSKLDDAWRQRHFVANGNGWRVTDWLGQSIRWKQADLLRRAEAGPWDLILWRNMAIYLDPAAAECVWMAIVGEMAPGGFLVTGKADHPPRLPELEKIAPCVYRRHSSQ